MSNQYKSIVLHVKLEDIDNIKADIRALLLTSEGGPKKPVSLATEELLFAIHEKLRDEYLGKVR